MGVAAILVMCLDHLYILFSFPRRLHINLGFMGQGVLEKKIFENGGHIHVYSPGEEAAESLGSNVHAIKLQTNISPKSNRKSYGKVYSQAFTITDQ